MSKKFDIQEIAKLASIELNENEVKSLTEDLGIILEHVETLSNLELNDSEIHITKEYMLVYMILYFLYR